MLPAAGSHKRVIFPAAKSMPVWLYRPRKIKNPDRLIVAVHGISRQYQHQIEAYKTLAESYGCWLLVPEFSKEAFPQYQQLSKGGSEPRADLALNTVLVAWKHWQKQPGLKIHLCGYSGGAQFAHRYAMTHPQNVESLVLSSAGWYTFPEDDVPYPYGLADWPNWLGTSRFAEMVRLPMLVMVGEDDVERDKSLRQSKKLDRQQGQHRLERARRWSDAMSEYKRANGVVQGIRFCRLAGQGHDFMSNAQYSNMLQLIQQFWDEREWRKQCVV